MKTTSGSQDDFAKFNSRLLPKGALTVGIAIRAESQNIRKDETILVYTWEHRRQLFNYFA